MSANIEQLAFVNESFETTVLLYLEYVADNECGGNFELQEAIERLLTVWPQPKEAEIDG